MMDTFGQQEDFNLTTNIAVIRYSNEKKCFFPYPRDDGVDLYLKNKSLPSDIIDVPLTDQDLIGAMEPGDTLDLKNGRVVIVKFSARDPALILADAKYRASLELEEYAKAKRLSITGTSDLIAISAWANKLRIAKSIIAGMAIEADKSALMAEIDARGLGENLDQFCQKIISKADFYAKATGLIDGNVKKANEALTAAQSLTEVDATLNTSKAELDSAISSLTAA